MTQLITRRLGRTGRNVTTLGLGGQASLQWTAEGVDRIAIGDVQIRGMQGTHVAAILTATVHAEMVETVSLAKRMPCPHHGTVLRAGVAADRDRIADGVE